MGTCHIVELAKNIFIGDCWCQVGFSGDHCEIKDGIGALFICLALFGGVQSLQVIVLSTHTINSNFMFKFQMLNVQVLSV